MSHFNKPAQSPANTPNTTNLAAGQAFTQSVDMEIITILLTTFLNADKFYESKDETVVRLKALIAGQSYDPLFIAKAIIYARTVFGMRTITHVAAGEFAKIISGKSWARRFWERIVYRVDDMTEILAYLKETQGKTIKGKKRFPQIGALKRGFAAAFSKFSPYQLAKYRAADKDTKLVDVINFVHPMGNNVEYTGIKGVLDGTLKNEETWEAMLSAAGNDPEAKAKVWQTLLQGKKLGYLALLRNLRNIIEQAPLHLSYALEALIDPTFIGRSLIMPFQYITAYKELQNMASNSHARTALAYISKAVDVSLQNVPKFEGSTVVVLDVSGSMIEKQRDAKTKKEKLSPAEIGSLFATVVAKVNNADLMLFAEYANYVTYNILDTTLTIANSFTFTSAGTNFSSIFRALNKKYDRIIILSDMQGWLPNCGRMDAVDVMLAQFKNYRNKYQANPRIYSFDLQGYGSLQFHEDGTYLLDAGFSDKTMQLMQYLEKDKDALRTEINKIEL